MCSLLSDGIQVRLQAANLEKHAGESAARIATFVACTRMAVPGPMRWCRLRLPPPLMCLAVRILTRGSDMTREHKLASSRR